MRALQPQELGDNSSCVECPQPDRKTSPIIVITDSESDDVQIITDSTTGPSRTDKTESKRRTEVKTKKKAKKRNTVTNS